MALRDQAISRGADGEILNAKGEIMDIEDVEKMKSLPLYWHVYRFTYKDGTVEYGRYEGTHFNFGWDK